MTEYIFRSSETIWLPVIKDGSDLGSSFDHSDGYIYFLFGDTPSENNYDPIGRTNIQEPGPDGITLEILREYLTIVPVPGLSTIPYIGHGEFDVPTGGFSSGDRMHVFFTTDHFQDDAGGHHMGRCVLASSKHPHVSLQHLAEPFRVDVEVSQLPKLGGVGKFINVCPRIVNTADYFRLPLWFGSQGVFMWGSGDYRRSDVYLAFAPLNLMRDSSKASWIYYAGDHDWVHEEEKAKPLLGLTLSERLVGELSVSFIPGLNLWIMMYSGGFNPRFALSPTPWGPWIKHNLNLQPNEPDGAFSQTHTTTSPYGFYIIDRFTEWNGVNNQATIYFTVSENDLDHTGIYRTHLVKSVLTFEKVEPDVDDDAIDYYLAGLSSADP